MDFRTHTQKDRRLSILLLLMVSDGYQANEYLLRSGLEGYGHSVSGDLLRTELAWLEQQGAILCQEIGDVRIATITQVGVDLAQGRAQNPGIRRPTPRA